MTRRTKLILLVMALVSVLGLTVATNAWFVSVSATPPGKISSALVRYLPDSGRQTIPSILDYGNLISGSGADVDGVALVLPGDRLLPRVTTNESGKQVVRSSIARTFEVGETVDTVIHWEIRRSGEVDLTYKQRDLMRAGTPANQWFKSDNPPSSPWAEIDNPLGLPPSSADYAAETTSSEVSIPITTAEGYPATQSTITVTTLYTPRMAGVPHYKLVTTTIDLVIKEPATITPAKSNDSWAAATPTHMATETVIFVDATAAQEKLPTRSLLLISPLGATLEGAVIPLVLENWSTVSTNVRIGLNARLTPADHSSAATALEARWKDNTCYLGTVAPGTNYFIELLSFRPAANWKRVVDTSSSHWVLWNLTTDGTDTAIPPVATEPVRYPVTSEFGIVSRSSDLDGSIPPVEFETLFNQLYCEKVPTITIHLSYYVRQSEFMDWTEFYSAEIDMGVFQ